MIDVYLEQKTIVVGEAVSGKLIWHPDRNKMPKRGFILIVWYTEGRGTRDRQTVEKLRLDQNQLVLVQGGGIPFSLNVPDGGPITYNGTLIRVIWELQVVINMPGLLTRDEKLIRPFQVIPRQSA